MKTMTQEEKAKAYDESLEKAKQVYNDCICCRKCLNELFPVLAESEDERIRKEMLQIAKESEDSFYMVLTPNKRETLIAWLEKQGENFPILSNSLNIGKDEQKPAWSEEDEEMVKDTLALIETVEDINKAKDGFLDVKLWLKFLKDRVQPQPKQNWSEEDEEMVKSIIDYMKPMPVFFESVTGESGEEYTEKFIKEAIDWLKSLKPQNRWKPSKGQMEALKEACNEHYNPKGELYSLYEQLKAL